MRKEVTLRVEANASLQCTEWFLPILAVGTFKVHATCPGRTSENQIENGKSEEEKRNKRINQIQTVRGTVSTVMRFSHAFY